MGEVRKWGRKIEKKVLRPIAKGTKSAGRKIEAETLRKAAKETKRLGRTVEKNTLRKVGKETKRLGRTIEKESFRKVGHELRRWGQDVESGLNQAWGVTQDLLEYATSPEGFTNILGGSMGKGKTPTGKGGGSTLGDFFSKRLPSDDKVLIRKQTPQVQEVIAVGAVAIAAFIFFKKGKVKV